MAAAPVAVCSSCGHFAWSVFQIGQQCSERNNIGIRCRGVNSSAAHYTFRECPACGGTGNKCLRCSGHRLIAEVRPS